MSRLVARSPIQTERSFALNIARRNPCSGLRADVRVFDAGAVYGPGARTALTVQHNTDLRQGEWIALSTIIAPYEPFVD